MEYINEHNIDLRELITYVVERYLETHRYAPGDNSLIEYIEDYINDNHYPRTTEDVIYGINKLIWYDSLLIIGEKLRKRKQPTKSPIDTLKITYNNVLNGMLKDIVNDYTKKGIKRHRKTLHNSDNYNMERFIKVFGEQNVHNDIDDIYNQFEQQIRDGTIKKPATSKPQPTEYGRNAPQVNPFDEMYHQALQYIKTLALDNIVYTAEYLMNLDDVINLPPPLQQAIINEYYKRKDRQPPTPPPPKQKPLKQRIEEYVTTHHDDLLSKDEFIKVIKHWPNTIGFDKAYDYYKQSFFKVPTNNISFPETPFNNLIGYKSKNKIDALQTKYNLTANTNASTNYFPLKRNIKHYSLHKVSLPHTYIIDLMFDHGLIYIIAINVNTKYLYTQLVNRELKANIDEQGNEINVEKITGTIDTRIYLEKLREMFTNGFHPKHLISDGENAFGSKIATTFYKQHNITYQTVPRQAVTQQPSFMITNERDKRMQRKTNPLHSSLGILDRVIRTIRDMAYNMNVVRITPKIMNNIVLQYNNAPHKALSKWLGFQASPQMVHDDYMLEEYIIRQITKANNAITNSYGYNIPPNTHVNVYNEKDSMIKRRTVIQPNDHKVIGKRGALFIVADNKNKVQYVPRYKLDPHFNTSTI